MEEARWIRKDIWAACMGEPLERAVFSFQQGNTSSAYHGSQAIAPGMAEDTGLRPVSFPRRVTQDTPAGPASTLVKQWGF